MKIKCKKKSYQEVLQIKKNKRKLPPKPCFLLRKLAYFLSKSAVKDCGVEYVETGMDELGKKEPCLILMNHSCFFGYENRLYLFKKQSF